MLSLVLGVIDFGMAFAQTINLQGAAREARGRVSLKVT